jgi:hypothetical protein
MGTGEKAGTWGTTNNTNLGTALSEAITGSADVTFASGTVTLTLTDTNATQTARNFRLNLIGTSGGAQNLIVPAIEKLYLVNNACADTITIKNSTGTGVAVPAGKSMLVFNNATNVVDAITYATGMAPLASPTFTGTVTLPTLVGTDTTEATTPTAAAFKTAGGLGVAKDVRLGKDLYQSYAGVGANYVYHLMENTDNTNAGSNCEHALSVGGSSAGDPVTTYSVTGAAYIAIGIDNSDSDKFKISNSLSLGTGDALTITTAGAVAIPGTLAVVGSVLSTGTGGVGYTTGAGGTVTQAASKATAVTLNKVCGQITLHNASLAAAATVNFALNNSVLLATDNIQVWIVNSVSGAERYQTWIGAVAAGICTVNIRNMSGGPLTDAVVIGFAIGKAVKA